MKNIISCFLLLTIFCFGKCKKDKENVAGLPPATQEGKNTLGFLLNGQPWTPKGFRGGPNLKIDFDPGYRNGIINIIAYDFVPATSEQFTIGVKDSLNFFQFPTTLNLNQTSLFVISFSKICRYYSSLNDVISTGSLTISKLDRTNRIIAGTFNATLYRIGCDTIKISEGRFDMKF